MWSLPLVPPRRKKNHFDALNCSRVALAELVCELCSHIVIGCAKNCSQMVCELIVPQ